MIYDQINKLVKESTDAVLGKSGQPFSLDCRAEWSDKADLSSSCALKLSRPLSLPPNKIADQLLSNLGPSDLIEKVEVASPGFLNFTLKDAAILREVASIDQNYGKKKDKGQKIQVEFISANPTGPLTLGNARGGFIGDVLANVLENAGHQVTREYYFNDAGTQISKLVESVKAAAGVISPEEVQYRGAYTLELAKKFNIELGQKDDKELGRLLTKEIFERYIKGAIEKMNINFDEWFNESQLLNSGDFDKVLDRLKKEGIIYEKEGAVWLKPPADVPSERERVLVKSNGDITYLGTDIAYHLNIFEKRKFDKAVKVWGADHAGQIVSLLKALERLGHTDKLDFLIVQWVRLMKNGREFKISKRAGTYVTVEELVDQVGADVARYFIVRQAATTHMDFDFDLAKEHSSKNPVYYVQYSYARASKLLQEAENRKIEINKVKASKFNHPAERKLAIELIKYPSLVSEVAGDYQLQKLAGYAEHLAKIFHEFYEECPIFRENQHTAERIFLVSKYRQVLQNLLKLIGVSAPESM